MLDDEHEWFRNYLQSRTQIVEFQGVSSAAEPVSVGVPQESILGPLLFILHPNDLPSAVVTCSILMYTDDTVVVFSAPEVSAIHDTLVRELRAIECWLHLNSLFINITKTEAMLFGTSQKVAKINRFSVTINGSAIKHVTKFKYLGIILHEHLSWNEHVKAIVSKAGRRVGMLGRVRRYITSESANAIYISMIRPILAEYYAGVCGEVNSGTLEALQRRVGRINSNQEPIKGSLYLPYLASESTLSCVDLLIANGPCLTRLQSAFVEVPSKVESAWATFGARFKAGQRRSQKIANCLEVDFTAERYAKFPRMQWGQIVAAWLLGWGELIELLFAFFSHTSYLRWKQKKCFVMLMLLIKD